MPIIWVVLVDITTRHTLSICKRWPVFGWKVHFWHSIFRPTLGFLAYNWTIYWTMDMNSTHTHNVHTLEYLYSKIEWYIYRFKGTTGVLGLHLQHTSNVNGLWEWVSVNDLYKIRKYITESLSTFHFVWAWMCICCTKIDLSRYVLTDTAEVLENSVIPSCIQV